MTTGLSTDISVQRVWSEKEKGAVKSKGDGFKKRQKG